jgi:hypothetical protein
MLSPKQFPLSHAGESKGGQGLHLSIETSILQSLTPFFFFQVMGQSKWLAEKKKKRKKKENAIFFDSLSN